MNKVSRKSSSRGSSVPQSSQRPLVQETQASRNARAHGQAQGGQVSGRTRDTRAHRQTHEPFSVSKRLGRLQFHLSGKFRVLQVADIQEGPTVAKDTVRLIARACDDARPDLVVFTGNQIKGYDPAFSQTFRSRSWGQTVVSAVSSLARFGIAAATPATSGTETSAERENPLAHTRRLVRDQASQFLAPLIERGIPFAVTYGNHDFQCGLNTSELDAIYREFPGCLNPEASKAETGLVPRHVPASGMDGQTALSCEPGTFALPVWDLPSTTPQDVTIRKTRALEYPQAAQRNGWSEEQSGRPVLVLTLVNSGDYSRQGGYGSPSSRALGWLSRLPQVPGLSDARPVVFQHFPIPQYYGLLTVVPANRDGAIEGYRHRSQNCYVLNPDLTLLGSRLGEGISCPDRDSGEYDILCADRAVGLFTGHDHRNAFAGRLADPASTDLPGATQEGADPASTDPQGPSDPLPPLLCATPTSGFGSYGPPTAERAIRLVEFDIRHPYEPRTRLLTFGGLVGGSSSRSVYTFATSHVPVNVPQTRDLLQRRQHALVGAAAGGALAAGLVSGLWSLVRRFFTHRAQRS